MMAAAPEISEQHTSNLYRLLNVEASEEAAITGGSEGAPNYNPLSFHWSHYTNLLVVLAPIFLVAWLVWNKYMKRNRNQAQEKDINNRIQMANIAKSEMKNKSKST